MKRCLPMHDDLWDFMYEALPGYEEVGRRLDCDTKTVDNALQRVKRKVGAHLAGREQAA